MAERIVRTQKDGNLAWLDLEMTGLDAQNDVILQAALIVTNADLVPLEEFVCDIWQPDGPASEQAMPELAPTMYVAHILPDDVTGAPYSLPRYTGTVLPGHGLKLGYYAQEHETLELARTVVENLQSAAPQLTETEARSVLGSFLFSGDDAYKPARVLSGGEKTRLALATLVVSTANVLLLDEPTNNLDPASREEVLAAIASYEGAIVLVTHDEGAVMALNPDRVLILPDGVEDLWSEDYAELVALA